MSLRRHTPHIPFETIANERDLPMRGIIPSGTFITRRPYPAEGWREAGLPVPSLARRVAKILYSRGDIVPVPLRPTGSTALPAPTTSTSTVPSPVSASTPLTPHEDEDDQEDLLAASADSAVSRLVKANANWLKKRR